MIFHFLVHERLQNRGGFILSFDPLRKSPTLSGTEQVARVMMQYSMILANISSAVFQDLILVPIIMH